MKYLLLLTNTEEAMASWEGLSEEEQKRLREAEMPAWGELFGWIERKGLQVEGLELDEPKNGKLVQVRDGETIVTDGPFAETKELIAGFWLWQVRSMDEAVEWAKRCPNPTGEESVLEIRPVFETEDFGEVLTPELRAQEERLRAQTSARK